MRSLRPMTIVVVATCLAITAAVAWTAWSVNGHSNQRLLSLELRQTASVLGNQVPVISTQLLDAAQVAEETNADPETFRRFATPRISSAGPFASISLWRLGSAGPTLLSRAGVEPILPSDPSATAFFAKIRPSRQMYVTGILPGSPPRLGYATRAPDDTSGFVVYAERLLRPDRRVVQSPESPFAGLNLAIYLGRQPTDSQLIESTAPTPIRGRTESAAVPFGDTALTVIGSSSTRLAGTLSATLPWFVIVVGCMFALMIGGTIESVSRRRLYAETLARKNARLYHEQRDIAGTLQHALLPEVSGVRDLQVAARYVPGVTGTEVGGDWYDVISQEPGRCVFVVGDVSGRGLRAATTMASLRFAIRAYVAQGDPIGTVLTKLSRLLRVDDDRQFATVLIGEIDTARGRISLASAGHLTPLLLADGRAEFLDCRVEPPIGVSDGGVTPTSVTVDGPATLLAFTDGFVERSPEVIDLGLERLRKAALEAADRDVDDLLDDLTSALAPDGRDDAVILGLRWTR